MPTQTEKAERFLTLHDSAQPLLMPNPWDRGSAALLASLGFHALAPPPHPFPPPAPHPRLQSSAEAGADVLFAPGVTKPEEIRELVASVDRPVNVLALPGTPPVAELAAMGVKRISIGGAFAFYALDALAHAAREFRERGSYGYWDRVRSGAAAARPAFGL